MSLYDDTPIAAVRAEMAADYRDDVPPDGDRPSLSEISELNAETEAWYRDMARANADRINREARRVA